MEEEKKLTSEEQPEEKEAPSSGKKLKKKALGAAAAVTTGAAVLVNGLFGSPDEIMKTADELNKPAVIQTIDDGIEDDDEADGQEEEDEENGPSTFWGKTRSWIWSWPLPLRVLIGIPLWTLGWGVCQGWQLLWKAVLSPVLQALTGVATLFAVLAGVLALAGRAAFPAAAFTLGSSSPNNSSSVSPKTRQMARVLHHRAEFRYRGRYL